MCFLYGEKQGCLISRKLQAQILELSVSWSVTWKFEAAPKLKLYLSKEREKYEIEFSK